MDAIPGVVVVLCLSCLVYGAIIVSLARRVEQLERDIRLLVDCSNKSSRNFIGLAQIVEVLSRKRSV